jgi:hypothetical protein
VYTLAMETPAPRSHAVLADLQSVFGSRLEAFVTYSPETSPRPSLAIVSAITFADLNACAASARRWAQENFATPVVLTRAEFGRSLDAFPVEFGEIIDQHEVLHGADPFAGLTVAPSDLRRACEAQVRSLLLHLREDYMEAGGRSAAVRAVVVDSAPEFRALVRLLARLDARRLPDHELATWAEGRLGLQSRTVSDVLYVATHPGGHDVDPERLFPVYLAATERLAVLVDEWR